MEATHLSSRSMSSMTEERYGGFKLEELSELLGEVSGDKAYAIKALQEGTAFVHTSGDCIALLAGETNDVGEPELLVWHVKGMDCLKHQDEIKEIARSCGYVRIVTRVTNRALLRMLQRSNWEPRSVELTMEI